jgi:hypothetical protein
MGRLEKGAYLRGADLAIAALSNVFRSPAIEPRSTNFRSTDRRMDS